MAERTECDIAIAGGGILGLAIAALASQRGYRVLVARLGDQGRPRADTLRNQGWLQSGIMYINRFATNRDRGRVLAKQMYAAGVDMLHDLEIPEATSSGVLRVRTPADAQLLEADAALLRLPGVSPFVDRAALNRELGPLLEEGIYYKIPDSPFPEAEVLARLRGIAERHGTRFLIVDQPMQFESSARSESGVRLRNSDHQVDSRVTIAAAGAGTLQLLQDLRLDPQIAIQQTPLLVLNGVPNVATPLFADRARGFSLVRHPCGRGGSKRDAIVVGTKVVRRVEFALPDAREISKEDIEEFASCLPPALSHEMPRGRFTAGYEVVNDDSGLEYFEPDVRRVAGFRGLWVAMPGRATMGLFVAREVLQAIERELGPPRQGQNNGRAASEWRGDILMHYHPDYAFNDGPVPQDGQS